ncbi:MAG: heme-binding domain-containing protein [Bacteroidales bacterium]|nr:heme-binding domain-containing protein [Bacteroidales bacterium]MDD4604484.1 heme-binding domain-containing protein [Bacteroidales bacterium]
MRKSIILVSTVFIAFFLLINVNTILASGQKTTNTTSAALPDNMMKFVQRACMDCHSDKGSALARGKVNFSKWGDLTIQKQSDKANTIFKVLSKESMPPKSWKKNNPDLIPTKAEVEMVGKWVNSLK